MGDQICTYCIIVYLMLLIIKLIFADLRSLQAGPFLAEGFSSRPMVSGDGTKEQEAEARAAGCQDFTWELLGRQWEQWMSGPPKRSHNQWGNTSEAPMRL